MTPELLAPAGDEGCAEIALRAGADAVYLGLDRFSARASAANFTLEALRRTARYAHILGKKVYVALNTLVKDGETATFFRACEEAWDAGADALLIQDMFLGKALKEAHPEIVLHLSTQGGCCNVYGAELARACGFSRAVLARETPLSEIAKISAVIETESFVQGALCTCFSGQCYLSSFAGNNSGNRGRCKQPCRKQYTIDRAPFTGPAYALSTSDLSVGEDIGKLQAAGVCSFKIEGRLRRPEYVEAAVRYYRALLGGDDAREAFSHLKRAYNRGDYTRGLAFGQKEDFLSRKVQGHIGERVGFVSLRGGKYFVKSGYSARPKDGFKILRGGEEAGGAAFSACAAGGFFISSPVRLKEGEEVRLTTENYQAPMSEFRRPVEILVSAKSGAPMSAVCGEVRVMGPIAEPAKSAPLSEEEIGACFSKTDLPFLPRVRVETDGVFLPKSALNAFRRTFFEALGEALSPARTPLAPASFSAALPSGGEEGLIAAIAREDCAADLFIHKPRDFSSLRPPRADAYLYLPPFLTTEEAEDILSRAEGYAGIYCDGYFGLALAKKYGKKFFAGTGFHLSNRISVAALSAEADYFALSAEISLAEQRALRTRGAFCLTAGGIKVMDLIYCPFSRTCKTCDRRACYTLTDGDGRAFPLVRYRVGEACRFEVYNCAPLAAYGGGNALADLTEGDVRGAAYAKQPELFYGGATKGHAARSVL